MPEAVDSAPNGGAGDRHDFVDELRGFALIGIALVNAPQLAVSAYGWTDAAVLAPWDRAAAVLVAALAQAKFYPLFAFLFGYSARLAMNPARSGSTARFARRLAMLGVLGALHAALLYSGDILFFYATLGVGLLWVRGVEDGSGVDGSDRRAARLFRFGAIAWVAIMVLMIAATYFTREIAVAPGPSGAVAGLAAMALDSAMTGGQFLAAAGPRLRFWWEGLSSFLLFGAPQVVALFALGWWAAGGDLLSDPARHAAFWRRAALSGITVGLPLALVSAWWQIGPGVTPSRAGAREFIGYLLITLAGPVLSLGYVGLLATLRNRFGADALAGLRPAGRTSLTIYLGESIALSLVFGGWGLGLYARFGAAAVTLVALGVAASAVFIAAASPRARRGHGPVETLMRRFTGRG